MSSTEAAEDRYRGIETWETRSLVDAMIEGQLAAVSAVRAAAPEITRAVDEAAQRLERGGRLIYLGAGTSGRLATLDAAELPPTYGWPRERAVSIIAGGARAVTDAVEGAEDDETAAAREFDALGLEEDDVVIGLAASGRTPFVRAGLEHAGTAGALTISILMSSEDTLSAVSDICIRALTGSEIVAGSTRMKAGTAQKVVLTCFSTGIFVRMGFVYRGRMVEMAPTNAKLSRRAVRMVADLTDRAEDEAQRALDAAGGSIKTAVVMLEKDLDAGRAAAAVEAAGGRLHRALQ